MSLALGATACAQDQPIDPAKRASIEELLTLMKIDEMQKQVMPQVQKMMTEAIQKAVPPEMENSKDRDKVMGDLQDFQQRILGVMRDKIDFASMKPTYIKLYDETFSTEEVAGIVAFYKTPAGQAYVAKLPVLTGKMIDLMQGMMADLMPQLQRLNEQWVDEMKRKYGNADAK
jgi:hypothetical protein